MALTNWEQAIYKLVREYSGATKADTEGEDLPALVDECMGELARQAEQTAAIGLAAFRAGWVGNVPLAEFVCERLAATADAPVAETVTKYPLPEATLRVMFAATNPMKPLGMDVLVDGKSVAVLTFDAARAALSQGGGA